MSIDIFQNTKNFTFTENDRKADVRVQELIKEARSELPEQFYSVYSLIYSEQARNTKLFKVLKTIPKGCMHHLHIDCTEDQDFYRKYVVTDPRTYLAEDLKTFKVGTKEEAEKQKWVTMADARKKFQSEQEFISAIANITMFNKQQIQKLTGHQKQIWDAFEQKICNFFVIIFTLHHFKNYIKHILTKYANTGYDRIQFRALLSQLTEYDQLGNKVKTHEEKKYIDTFDEAFNEVKKEHPNLTTGIIWFGLKVFSDEMNEAIFTKVCDYNWDKTIGFDFVQQEDLFGELDSYDKCVDRVLAKYPHLNYKKVYHAGQTRDHMTNNIEIAIKSGAVRLGHGLNILQTPDLLPLCKHICFEKNPISNLMLGYISDTRLSSAPIMLGLGYAVTINPDDPGKFGLEDNTMDYMVASLSYKWTLKHLKLIAIHSINHAVCEEGVKARLLTSFNLRWNTWIEKQILNDCKVESNPFVEEVNIFSSIKNWSFSPKQIEAENKYIELVKKTRKDLPFDFYHNDKFLFYLNEMKNQSLFKWMKNIPKSVLQHNHFYCDEDFDFYKRSVVNDPNLYLNPERTEFRIGNKKEAEQNKWISVSSLRKQFASEDQFVQKISQITVFSEQELKALSGKQKQIWKVFQVKMDAFMPILTSLHFFRPYVRHVFEKFINNNYDRVELRATIGKLRQYNNEGNLVKVHDYRKYVETIDQVLLQVQKEHPNFTAGFIFAGLKAESDQQNEAMFVQICELNWNKTLGFDFVQQQALYGSLNKYDSIVDRVLKKYPHLDYKKVYHAGESKNQYNTNLEIAIRSGSVRIGDGVNSLQRIQFLTNCKHVCFEKNPTTNLLLGYSGDSRTASAPVLLGLGFPVTINSDDPGKFRLQDATSDYFMAAVSYKWKLRHLKLIAIHALNHSLCPFGQKIILEQMFNKKWDVWIDQFLADKIQ